MSAPSSRHAASEARRAVLRAREVQLVHQEFILLMALRSLQLLETLANGPREIRALNLATETLGSFEKARDWLVRPNRGLGGVKPCTLLETDEGLREVENVLARIEHGIYG